MYVEDGTLRGIFKNGLEFGVLFILSGENLEAIELDIPSTTPTFQ